jgi:hypothetical protein
MTDHGTVPTWFKGFIFSPNLPTSPGAHPSSYVMGTADDFPSDKITVWGRNMTIYCIYCQS